jgi:hypothetical protein
MDRVLSQALLHLAWKMTMCATCAGVAKAEVLVLGVLSNLIYRTGATPDLSDQGGSNGLKLSGEDIKGSGLAKDKAASTPQVRHNKARSASIVNNTNNYTQSED